MIRIILIVLLLAIYVAIIWYFCFSPTYTTCTKCGHEKAKVDFTKDVWQCPKCGYGKYLRR